MSQTESLSQRWEKYRPSKTLWIWSVIGAALATMILGFTAGGWTTGGTAAVMADKAAKDARIELAASICVQKFVGAEGAAEKLAALKETSSWERDSFVEDGGWAKLAGMEKSIPGTADLCAEELVAMDSLPATTSESVVTGG
jgi:hypothetical protein